MPHSGIREVIKPALELLSAVPTVVYGYFALVVRDAGPSETLAGAARLLTCSAPVSSSAS